MKKKILTLFLGILILALGTSICNFTGLGIDPFNAFCTGISVYTGISVGTCVLLGQCLLAGTAFYLNRAYLGIGSVIPMIFFGYFLEFFNWLLPKIMTVGVGLLGNLFLFLAGMILITAGMTVYMNCNLGMVPYDSVSFIISERTGGNCFVLRVLLDTCFAASALLVKGPISVGTILLAFGTGPLLKVMRQWGPKKLSFLRESI